MIIRQKIEKCYVCGALSRQRVIVSASGRDIRAMRGASRVKKCPRCGYVAERLSDKTTVTEKWLEKVKEHSLTDFKSSLAADFYLLYLIAGADEKHKLTDIAILLAIRECEAAGDRKNAAMCRSLKGYV